MSEQPSSLPNNQSPQAVQAGLTVRTALRAGAANPLDNVEQTMQGWWQSLRNVLPSATPGHLSGQ